MKAAASNVWTTLGETLAMCRRHPGILIAILVVLLGTDMAAFKVLVVWLDSSSGGVSEGIMIWLYFAAAMAIYVACFATAAVYVLLVADGRASQTIVAASGDRRPVLAFFVRSGFGLFVILALPFALAQVLGHLPGVTKRSSLFVAIAHSPVGKVLYSLTSILLASGLAALLFLRLPDRLLEYQSSDYEVSLRAIRLRRYNLFVVYLLIYTAYELASMGAAFLDRGLSPFIGLGIDLFLEASTAMIVVCASFAAFKMWAASDKVRATGVFD